MCPLNNQNSLHFITTSNVHRLLKATTTGKLMGKISRRNSWIGCLSSSKHLPASYSISPLQETSSLVVYTYCNSYHLQNIKFLCSNIFVHINTRHIYYSITFCVKISRYFTRDENFLTTKFW